MYLRPRLLLLLLMLGAISVLFQQDTIAASEETKCVGGMTYTTNVEHPTPDCLCPLGQIFHMNIKGNTKNVGGCVNDPYYTQAGSGNDVEFVLGGQAGKIRYSYDGQIWTEGTGIDANHTPAAIAFNGRPAPNSMWVMVARDFNFSNGADVRVYQSTDGIAWTYITDIAYPPERDPGGIMCNLCSLQYGGESGRVVFTDAMYSESMTYAWYSDDDGLTWTKTDVYTKSTGNTDVRKIVFNDEDNMFMTVGQNDSIHRSFNGQSFGNVGSLGIANVSGTLDIAYGDGMYTVVGSTGVGDDQALIATSTDGGASWTRQTDPGTFTLGYFAVAHNGLSGASSMWTAGGGSNDSKMAYSYDGITWSTGVYNIGTYDCSVLQIVSNGPFWVAQAYCYAPETAAILYSSDGINWNVMETFTDNWPIDYALAARRMINYHTDTFADTWVLHTRSPTGTGHTHYSLNGGTTWNTTSGIPSSNYMIGFRHNGKPFPDDLWTADSYSSQGIYTSTNAATWSQAGTDSTDYWHTPGLHYDIDFAGNIIYPNGDATNMLYRSTPPYTSATQVYYAGTDGLGIVRYAANASKWLLFDNCEKIAYSTDGVNWSDSPPTIALNTLSCAQANAYDLEYDGNKRWLAIGETWAFAPNNAPGIYYSDDQGQTWTAIPVANKPTDEGLFDVAHNRFYGSSGKWIGIGGDDFRKLYSSADGVTWSLAYTAPAGWTFERIVCNSIPGSPVWMVLAQHWGNREVGIFRSTNNGVTWTGPIFTTPDADAYNFSVLEHSSQMR